MADTPITLGYWSIRGLAAPLRMMLMYAKQPFILDCYDLLEKPGAGFPWEASPWFVEKKPVLKAKNPLINLPYVCDGDLVISQSNACMTYLGRKLGLWGDSDTEKYMCEQLLCEIIDMRNKMTDFVYHSHLAGDEAAIKEAALKVIDASIGILTKLEGCLALNEKGADCFFVTGHATAPDFHCWEMLDQYIGMAKYYDWKDGLYPLLADFPHLAAFHDKFAALPANATYFASPLSKMPYNNKMAVFGAVPSNGRYTLGQTCDWHNLSGKY